jgi:transcriptional regulator with XRE-family HTH domain
VNAERLRRELIRRQAGSSGRDFARRLGISESYWSLIKRGERPLTLPVIERALREFPELAPLFAAELAQRDADWLAAQTPAPVVRRRGVDRRAIRRLLFNGALAATVAIGLVLAAFGPGSRTQRFSLFGPAGGAALADEEGTSSAPRATRTPTPARTPTRTPTPTAAPVQSEDRVRPTRTPSPTGSSAVQTNEFKPSDIDCENLDELSSRERRRAERFCDRQEEKAQRREERLDEKCARKTAPPIEECRNEDSDESNNDSDGSESGESSY